MFSKSDFSIKLLRLTELAANMFFSDNMVLLIQLFLELSHAVKNKSRYIINIKTLCRLLTT